MSKKATYLNTAEALERLSEGNGAFYAKAMNCASEIRLVFVSAGKIKLVGNVVPGVQWELYHTLDDTPVKGPDCWEYDPLAQEYRLNPPVVAPSADPEILYGKLGFLEALKNLGRFEVRRDRSYYASVFQTSHEGAWVPMIELLPDRIDNLAPLSWLLDPSIQYRRLPHPLDSADLLSTLVNCLSLRAALTSDTPWSVRHDDGEWVTMYRLRMASLCWLVKPTRIYRQVAARIMNMLPEGFDARPHESGGLVLTTKDHIEWSVHPQHLAMYRLQERISEALVEEKSNA